MSIQGLAFFLSRDHLGIRRTIRRTSRALPISALGLLAVAGHVSAAQQDIKVCGAIERAGLIRTDAESIRDGRLHRRER